MGYQGFDKYASKYDAWFIENSNVLASEVKLVASCMKDCGKALSVGCGSGLMEKILREEYDILIEEGIEHAVGSWDHPLLQGVQPKLPYPIELVKEAAWRTTAEK